MTVALSVAGVALILIAVIDVFQTLLRPGTTGRLSHVVFRAAWAPTRRRPRLGVGGPLMVVGVVALWVTHLTFGWPLIYHPHIPAGFPFRRDGPRHHPLPARLTINPAP